MTIGKDAAQAPRSKHSLGNGISRIASISGHHQRPRTGFHVALFSNVHPLVRRQPADVPRSESLRLYKESKKSKSKKFKLRIKDFSILKRSKTAEIKYFSLSLMVFWIFSQNSSKSMAHIDVRSARFVRNIHKLRIPVNLDYHR